MGNMQNSLAYVTDRYEKVFEGIIDVDVDGVQALPQQITYWDASTGTEKTVQFHSVYA